MRPFKKPEDIEKLRRDFLDGAEDAEHKGDIWSRNSLKKLSTDDLVDRLDQIQDQYSLAKWNICLQIRRNFKGDKTAYGRYLDKMRVIAPDRAICTINTSTLFRYAKAAEFCERFKIKDITKAGILPSVIDLLTQKDNTDIAKDIVKQIKGGNISIKEVKRLIGVAKSIPTIHTQEFGQTEQGDYRQPVACDAATCDANTNKVLDHIGEQIVYLVSGIRQDHDIVTLQAGRAVIEVIESNRPHHDDINHTALLTSDQSAWLSEVSDDAGRRRELLLELSRMNAFYLTEAEAAQEVLMLVNTHRASAIKRIPILQVALRELDAMKYARKQ